MTTRYSRTDYGQLRQSYRTDDGYLFFDAYATRTGVFVYYDEDGNQILELRPPEEVLKADSMATLGLKPITDQHPEDVLVNRFNAKELMVGSVGSEVQGVRFAEGQGGFVKVSGYVYQDEAINNVDEGRQEMSCGYTCELDESPGEHPQFGRYDMIQRNISYNHLALVDRGRAGPSVRGRFDREGQPAGQPYPKGYRFQKAPIYHVDGGGLVKRSPELLELIRQTFAQLIENTPRINIIVALATMCWCTPAEIESFLGEDTNPHHEISEWFLWGASEVLGIDYKKILSLWEQATTSHADGVSDSVRVFPWTKTDPDNQRTDQQGDSDMATTQITLDSAVIELRTDHAEKVLKLKNDHQKNLEELKALKADHESLKAEHDTLKADKEEEHKAGEKLRAELDTLKADHDELKKKHEEERVDAEKLDAMIKERVAILDYARRSEVEQSKLDGNNEQLRAEICKKVYPTVNLDGASPEYVRATYDRAIEKIDEDNPDDSRLDEEARKMARDKRNNDERRGDNGAGGGGEGDDKMPDSTRRMTDAIAKHHERRYGTGKRAEG